jgi:hypothetical protein
MAMATDAAIVAQIKSMNFASFNDAWNWYLATYPGTTPTQMTTDILDAGVSATGATSTTTSGATAGGSSSNLLSSLGSIGGLATGGASMLGLAKGGASGTASALSPAANQAIQNYTQLNDAAASAQLQANAVNIGFQGMTPAQLSAIDPAAFTIPGNGGVIAGGNLTFQQEEQLSNLSANYSQQLAAAAKPAADQAAQSSAAKAASNIIDGGPATTNMAMGMSTAMAAFAQYEVYSEGIKTGNNASGGNIAGLIGSYFGATLATMYWLSKLSHYKPVADMVNAAEIALSNVVKVNSDYFTVSIHNLPGFLLTLAVAGSITAIVMTMGIIAGENGSAGADNTPTGAAIASALAAAPSWYDSIPSAAVGMLAAGLTIGGTAYNLSPGSLFTQFSVPTVQLNTAISATGSSGAQILVLPSQSTGGYDTVYVVTPGANGNSTVSEFQVDKNGYLIGPNGPSTNYMPFETPTVDASGNPTGYNINQGAFNALYQIPACTSIANDTSMDAATREGALETCLRNNKNVQFIPIGG